MKRIAIVGGGISGLSAAFALEQRRRLGAQLEYVLYESSPRFGGVIHTELVDGCVVEGGPDSFLTEKAWAAELCRELGLADQLIASNDTARKTYILVKGRLLSLPDGLTFMVPTNLRAAFLSPLFSWRTKLRMIREWFYRPVPSGETTVADFVERHYGREMVERIADPLLAGIYGGSADELSLLSVLPRFAEMEARHGSLGRAMVAASGNRGGTASKPELRSTGQPGAAVPTLSALFTSLKNGMQQMTDALLARIPRSALRANTAVESVKLESGKWLVIAAGRTVEFDSVIIATPAHIACGILAGGACAELANELKAIRYSSSLTVTLGYDEAVRAALPGGFGFLVPRTENRRLLAATFMHDKFPGRAPQDRALVRCVLGGTRDERVLQFSEDEILSVVRDELRQILGISTPSLFARVYKWKQAMAQYNLGHSTRVERIRNLLAGMPRLAIAGNAYSGIGVPDCVRSGTDAAAKVVTDLGIS